MVPRPTPATCLMLAAVVMIVEGFAAPSSARVVANTVDPVAIMTDAGHHLVLTGPITCTAGERVYLRVTVTQRETGAVAEGRTRETCTGDTQRWEVHAATQGNAAFRKGPATAVAVGRTTTRADTTDANQWLVEITLAGE